MVLQSKVEAIVDSYLDLARPPWLLVSIPAHIVHKVVETAAQHMQGLIVPPSMHTIVKELEHLEWAKQVLVNSMTSCWGDFLVKWYENNNSKQSDKGEPKDQKTSLPDGEHIRTYTLRICSAIHIYIY